MNLALQTGSVLYDRITEKFKTTEAYQWPPTARDLEDQDDIHSPLILRNS